MCEQQDMLAMFLLLAQAAAPSFDALPGLGATGLIGGMWLWERRQSTQRERQLDDAHNRIMADRVQIDTLIGLVERNTQAMAALAGKPCPVGVAHG